MDDMSQCSQPVRESVKEIEYIKVMLSQSVMRLLVNKSGGKIYNEHLASVSGLLNDLEEIPMTVGNLRITKIGKILTKYEKDLPIELARIAKKINNKWKEQLRVYRQEFKDRLNQQQQPKEIPDKVIKEEPLSQVTPDHQCTSINRTSTAFQTQNNTHNSAQPNQATLNFIVQQNLTRSISSTFFQEVHKNIDTTMKRVCGVENECIGIRTTLEEMKQRLDLFENNISKFVSSTNNPPASINEKGSTGSDKVTTSPGDGENNVACSKSVVTVDAERAQHMDLMNVSDHFNVETDISNDPKIYSSSNNMNTKSNNEITRSEKTKKDIVHKRFEKHFDLNEREECIVSEKHVSSSASEYKSSLGNIFENINIVPEEIINSEVKNKKQDSSKKSTSKEHFENQSSIKAKPQSESKLKIKEEIIDISYGSDRNSDLVRDEKSMKRKVLQDSRHESISAKRPSPPKTNAIQSNNGENMTNQQSHLKSNLITSPSNSNIRSSIHSNKSYRSAVQSNSVTHNVVKSPQSKFHNVTIDSDGFKVPSLLTQTLVHSDANPFLLVKGERLSQEGTDLNLEDVELEPFLSYSQAIDDMSNEMEETERDYLLENKQQNRTSWNKFCKKEEGVKYAPLIKSNGRMKAAHKSSVGKQGIQTLLKKKRSKSYPNEN